MPNRLRQACGSRRVQNKRVAVLFQDGGERDRAIMIRHEVAFLGEVSSDMVDILGRRPELKGPEPLRSDKSPSPSFPE